MQLLRHVVPSYVVGSGHGRRTQGVNRFGIRAGNGFARSSFFVDFNDLGNGAVNTSAGRGGVSETFTRATVAWTKLASGLWAQVASGTARSVYSGFTTAAGEFGGYLPEGAGTQLVTPTASIRDMTDASWVAVTCTKAKTATGIDGVVNSASTLTATGATATVLQTLVAAATSRTYSAWVRRKTGSGTIILRQGTATLDITALINLTTYTRVELNDNELNVAFGFQINTSGDAIEVDFNQFEAGAFATTPMASAGAARNADVLTYPTSGWLNASAGTVLAQATVIVTVAAAKRIVEIHDGTANERIVLQDNGSATSQYVVTDGAAGQVNLTSGTIVVGTAFKVAGAYAVNDFALCFGGDAVQTDTTGTLPTVTTLSIGVANTGTTVQLFGPIRRVSYFPQRLPDAQLQALTS
ncbi:MAG: hypothetical protein WBM00_02155 [Solirubrobacterales bacterium]